MRSAVRSAARSAVAGDGTVSGMPRVSLYPVLLLALLGALGCATTKAGGASPDASHERPLPKERDPASVSVEPLQFNDPDGFAFVDGRSGESLSWDEVKARVLAAEFVVAGEQHDQLSHHRLQARLLEGLAASGDSLAVGLEMVPWHLQAPLDRFSRGELDVPGLFVALDWERTWGHNADLYRDIFVAGQEHRSRFVALNTPRDLARAVAKKGLDGLDAEERSLLPDMDLGDEEHRAELEAVFRHHHPPTGSGAGFENFYAVQVLWDESMAQRSVEAREDGAERVLVLAGVGHVAGYHGIPQRILRRLPKASLITVVPIEVEEGGDAQDAARHAVAGGVGDILAVKKPREVLRL